MFSQVAERNPSVAIEIHRQQILRCLERYDLSFERDLWALLFFYRRNDRYLRARGSALSHVNHPAALFVPRHERGVLIREGRNAFPREQFVVARRDTTNDEPTGSIAGSGKVKSQVLTS